MEIIGDPAWLQQGELWAGVAGGQFDYNPFLPDGTINYESQEPLFELLFNKPQDYDLSTGLADVGSNNYNASRSSGQPGEAVQTYIYKANHVTNTFSKGRYTQELEGTIVNFDMTDKEQSDKTRTPATTPTAARDPQKDRVFYQGPDNAGEYQSLFELEYGVTAEDTYDTGTTTGLPIQNNTPIPAAAQAAPTSGGQPVGTSSGLSPALSSGQVATGTAQGQPVSVQVFTTTGVRTVTSNEEIQALFNRGQITAQERGQAAQALNIKQRAANAPVTNQPSQRIARET